MSKKAKRRLVLLMTPLMVRVDVLLARRLSWRVKSGFPMFMMIVMIFKLDV